MCGINGFNFEDEFLIKEMNDSILHRGPDGEGTFVDNISLGHRRLSIIDLSDAGKQPMSNEDGTIWITFNGEIYNFQEIKEELQGKHIFKSNTDTEVIIHAYEEWGEDCVKKFNGMWAFAIYDKKKNLIFISRDRFGKKPIYYYVNNRQIIFSSEIKAILKHDIKKELNTKAISSYLSYRYVIGEETFFKGIKKLLPAHNLIFYLDSKLFSTKEYWDLNPSEIKTTEAESVETIDRILNKSIRYRKISDVPLGVILSGGLDSSLVTAILAKQEKNPINTFTVKFAEKGFDETSFAKLVSNQYNTNYHEVLVNTDNFLGLMKEYSKYKDEPIGIPNEVALYLLSKKIKDHVTVVLSGEGADEIFEGYGRKFSSVRDYTILSQLKSLQNGKEIYSEKFPNLFKKYSGGFFDSELDHFLHEYVYWTEKEKALIMPEQSLENFKPFFEKYFNKYKLPYEQKISYLFIKVHLPGLLNRLDSSTMASAVEGRAPLLDYDLVEYAFNLPLNYKTKWLLSENEFLKIDETGDRLSDSANISKHILRETAKKHLPDNIVKREKQGFPLPLDDWFGNEFEKIVKEYLLSENSKIKTLLNQEAISELINNPLTSKRFGQKIWMLLSLELWLREWFPEL